MQAAGQIADLGGGALMAAFGILAALRERDRSGEGQLVDVSMADGALSWLAMVAARYLAEERRPRRGELELAGLARLLPALRLRRRLGHARRAGAEVLAGVVSRGRARGPLEQQFDAPGLARPTARSRRSSRARTREEWRAFASEHDCCLEPVLDLDEALDSELVRAREMVVELDQPGAQRPVRLLGVPVKLSRTPGDAQPRARARAGRAHARGAGASSATARDEIAALLKSGRGGRAGGRRRRGPSWS